MFSDVLDWPFPAGSHGTPPPLYATLRRDRPVCPVRMPSGEVMWLLTRREDICAVATDHRRFTRNLTYPGAPRIAGEDFNSVVGGIFNLDPPDHTRIRTILAPYYTRAAVTRYADAIHALAHSLVDDLTTGPNPADLMTGYAEPLALRFNCDMLGIPVELRTRYLECFRTQTSQTAGHAAIADATAQISALARTVVDAHDGSARAEHPIGALLTAHREGTISEEELIGTVDYLMVTGVDPLISPTGTFVVTVLRHPGHHNRLTADPDRWPATIEELLRYHHNGYLSNPRVATQDITLHGQTIRTGQAVITPFLAACWDPAAYPKPAKFDPSRPTDGSLTFGHGAHYCLGSSLARLYLDIALRKLFTRLPTLALAIAVDDIPWDEDILFTRPALLPVTW
ncbi:cytochrome P450 [Streptomyces sp. YS-3]|uniref:cytochrome P450 n=1 Tax=Streptomyces sp. YS-3 TaxID=3381352 RepID=UPI0038628D70